LLIIVNPVAKNNVLGKQWPKYEKKLPALKTDYEIVFTEYREHARELAKDAVLSRNHDILVTAGGDGTTHEVAMGIKDSGVSPQDAPILAPLALGSSNDYSSILGIPRDLDEAIKIINSENTTMVNTIKCQGDDQPPGYCFNLGQVGLLSVFSYSAAVNREKPIFPFNIPPLSLLVRGGSPNRYTLVALKYILWKYSNIPSTITIDDQETRTENLTLFSFGVGQTYGQYPFCPDASLYGDAFATTIGIDLSRMTQLKLIGRIKKRQYDNLELSEAKKAVIELDSRVPGGSDGEPFAINAKKFQLSLEKKNFKVIAP
jgi:diacylglycerol kinase family enzyme